MAEERKNYRFLLHDEDVSVNMDEGRQNPHCKALTQKGGYETRAFLHIRDDIFAFQFFQAPCVKLHGVLRP